MLLKMKNNVINKEQQRLGIGTLSEKTLHAFLKNYYEPDVDKQEIPIDRYVADIFTDIGMSVCLSSFDCNEQMVFFHLA